MFSLPVDYEPICAAVHPGQTEVAVGGMTVTFGFLSFVIAFNPQIERFSNDCRKTKTKAITPTNHDRGKQRDEPITIPSNDLNLLKAREKSRVHGGIGFGFATHWLKN